jgi:predicted dehydrogenase
MLRFGILGTGNIARQFTRGVLGSARCRAVAVASRTVEAAGAFAAQYGIPAALSPYERLLERPDVDAVYVSLPNHLHCAWTIRALEAGKHVLCEKPLGANAAEARRMLAAAQRCGRVLIEAYMYRAHPQTHAALEVVRSGAIGRVRMIRTSFCFRVRDTRGNIRFDPAMAGGAIMDIGGYCLTFSHLFAGAAPLSASASGVLHAGGVDEAVCGVLAHPGGIISSFACGTMLQADNSAMVCGEEGYLHIPWPWKPSGELAEFHLCRAIPPRQDTAGKLVDNPPPPVETRQIRAGRDLYAVEADAFAAAVLDGAPPFMPHEHTLACMALQDELRRQVGTPVPPESP